MANLSQVQESVVSIRREIATLQALIAAGKSTEQDERALIRLTQELGLTLEEEGEIWATSPD